MARLILIRHGQASFLADDYDHLSPLGEEQAASLGRWWAEHDAPPDRVVSGALRRQRRTAELAAGSARGWPAIEVLPGLDEHQGDQLLRRHLPALAARFPELAALGGRFAAAETGHERGRAMGQMLDRVLRLWGDGLIDEIEPFVAFRDRVLGALGALQAQAPRGGLVVAFTSAGVIGAVVASVLQAPSSSAVELGMSVYNGSVTEFIFSPGRISLLRFNATPGLQGEALTLR